jgi:hypothetical protein
MDRAGHILIAFLITALLLPPAWHLRTYSRSHGHSPLAVTAARNALSGVLLFTWAYAWFGLLNLRIAVFFIVLQIASITLVHLLWRTYTPRGVEWRLAYLRMYGELGHSRRWLFILFTTLGILSWVASVLALYGGFAVIYRHPSYPALFAVLAVSGGLGLALLSVTSSWMLIQPALEDEARARLLLDLCNAWIIVFVCAAMAGIRALEPVKEIGLLPRPYHLQFQLTPLFVAAIVLAFLSLPMFLGGIRRTGEVQRLAHFERSAMERLARVSSPVEKDKVSSFSMWLEDLREHQQSFQRRTPPPGILVLQLLRVMVDDTGDDTPAVVNEDLEYVLKSYVTKIVAHRDRWTTISERAERVAEFAELAGHLDGAESAFIEMTRDEMNEFRDEVSSPILRFGARLMGFIFVYAGTTLLRQVASIARAWKMYLDELQRGDYRWRHLAWLETLIAHAEEIEQRLAQISGGKAKEKYLSRESLGLGEKLDVASFSSDEGANKKRFGAVIVVPFVVPVIMVFATPLIQGAFGLKQ